VVHGWPSGSRLLVGPIRLPRNARNPGASPPHLGKRAEQATFRARPLTLAETCAEPPDRGPRLNLPNLITIARILLVPIVVWAIAQRQMQIAFLLFVAAGASDAIDGFIAKRFHMASELGAHLDPLADKALIVSIYVSLGVTDAIPRWIVILVVSRDILIIGGVMLAWFLGHPMTVRPLLVSKLNTAAQILFACLVLAALGFGFNADTLQTFLLWTVAALTLISVGFYVREWWRHMNAGGAST
jgi:cardiolipin synthase